MPIARKRKVAVFTGNRAEYGLLVPVLEAIKCHSNLTYHLIVSGAHLDKEFGKTLEEINRDGYKYFSEVKIKMSSNSNSYTSLAIGNSILGMVKCLEKVKPDVLVVYADRFEGFAATIASTQMNIPTAHIEGGDITEGGALDDSVRHAMTKLSHLHFTTNHFASKRIIGMGEEKWRVKTVGFTMIDLINRKNFASRKEISRKFNLDTTKPIILFTQHSITTEYDLTNSQISISLKALEKFFDRGIQIICTYPNNDLGGKEIVKILERWKKKFPNKVALYKSLGRYYYHGILSIARKKNSSIVCVGNSSSGIKETPVFGCPTVNIGSRQRSRLRGSNVIDVEYDKIKISAAINKCLFDKKFKEKCSKTNNPYGVGNSGKKIANFLAKVKFDKKLLQKKMMLIK